MVSFINTVIIIYLFITFLRYTFLTFSLLKHTNLIICLNSEINEELTEKITNAGIIDLAVRFLVPNPQSVVITNAMGIISSFPSSACLFCFVLFYFINIMCIYKFTFVIILGVILNSSISCRLY